MSLLCKLERTVSVIRFNSNAVRSIQHICCEYFKLCMITVGSLHNVEPS